MTLQTGEEGGTRRGVLEDWTRDENGHGEAVKLVKMDG